MANYANNRELKLSKHNIHLLFLFVTLVLAMSFYFYAESFNKQAFENERTERIQNAFDNEVSRLLDFLPDEKNALEKLLPESDEPALVFFENFQNNRSDFFISIYDSTGELVAWNKNFRKINGAAPVPNVALQKTYLEKDNLFEIISVADKFVANNDKFYLKISFVLKKHFSLHNSYEERGDFAEKIEGEENARLVPVESVKDTDNFINLNGKPVAAVVFGDKVAGAFSAYGASLLFLFLFLSIALYFSAKINEPNRQTIAFIVSAFFFRAILFYIFNDFKTAQWSVTKPIYFSSDFAYGLFSSLLALFFTNVSAFVVFGNFAKRIRNLQSPNFSFGLKNFSAVVLLIFFAVILRAFGATMRSFIFDSNIKLFADGFDLENTIFLFFLFNVLLSAVAFVFVEIMILRLFLKLGLLKKNMALLALLVALTIFHLAIRTPQAPLYFKIVFAVAMWLLANTVPHKENRKKRVLFAALLASFASAFLLGTHEMDFERNLYKLAAEKIAKPNAFYYKYLIESETKKIADEIAREKIKLFNNSLAYRLWNYSRLPFETFSSAIEIANVQNDTVFFFYNSELRENEEKDFVVAAQFPAGGYSVRGAINFSPVKIFNSRLPAFFVADNQAAVSLARMLRLKLIYFENGKMKFSSIAANLTKTKKTRLFAAATQNRNKIFEYKISGKQYELLPVENKKANAIYVFAKPKTRFAERLFDALKIISLFMVFVLLPMSLVSVVNLKRRGTGFSFRAAIFAGLVTVSIVPLILLALYFRGLSEEKNLSSTLFKLNKKAVSVNKFLKNYSFDENDAYEAFEGASERLRFDFSVFYKDKIFFTTHPLFFENGVFPDLLNPEAIVNIEAEELNDILLAEKIERYERNVFYSKISFGGENYVIQIDEAFNPILLPMSEKELDIMLVTSYSVAALGIILLGLLLAYYLAKPINELTQATKEIAFGNLDLRLNTKAFGEVKELIDGFNYMAEELKTTQRKLLESERETAWREMARQVAHEIKNPLTPMKLSVQQLVAMKKEKDENFDAAFDKISASVLSQIELLKNIAGEFSALGKMPKVKLKKVNLREILKKVETLYSSKKVEIKIDKSIDGLNVNSDEEYLTRIFVNLFRNAEEAGADKIEISASGKGKKTEVFVKNNGEQIPDEAKDKIFEKNFTTKKRGSGLGLFIIERFLEETDGEITLVKSDEKETVFKLVLDNDG